MLKAALLLSIATMFATSSLAFAEAPVRANQIRLKVAKVDLPGKFPGACSVTGVVGQVYSGKTFVVGQTVTIQVPCSDGRAQMQKGPQSAASLLLDASVLKVSREGLASLDDEGRLNFLLEGRRIAPGDGSISGYRVIDGAALAISPT